MTKTELNEYRRQLTALGTRLGAQAVALRDELPPRAAGGESGAAPVDVPIDPAELATHLNEEEVGVTIVGNEDRLFAEIEAALARIDRGTFGRCEACGKPIARVRLKAVPYARRCIACARKPEQVAASLRAGGATT